jgi:hypothetical protein
MFKNQAKAYLFAKHFMIDMETIGLSRSPSIAQVGITQYVPENGKLIEKDFIDVRFSLNNQLLIDRLPCPKTLDEFWMKQDKAVLASVFEEPGLKFYDAMQAIDHYLRAEQSVPTPRFIWANGINDDIRWLEAMYEDFSLLHGSEIVMPFKYNQYRDFRGVIFNMRDIIHPRHKNNAAHDALADARFQGNILIDFINNYDEIVKLVNN